MTGEILILSSAEQALPGNVDVVVLAFLRLYSSVSAHS